MEKTEKEKRRFGLVGRNIAYSFSRGYFKEKFRKLGLEQHYYDNFDLEDIAHFTKVIAENKDLVGLNVTIPYKESVMAHLDEIDSEAQQIGAVNTIKLIEGDKLKGFNTDVYGFETSLRSCWRGTEKGALILGTGGASKAVSHVFKKMGISYVFVSRGKENKDTIRYEQLDEKVMASHDMIVNCSPLGTFPDVDVKPDIPYEFLTDRHLLYDLIYNPRKTAFLKMGENAGAIISNGGSMLKHQADKSWEIWNS